MTTPTTTPDALRDMSDAEVIEQLAAIEHERWSDWQRYVHECGTWTDDGDLRIERMFVERWQRQINTPYADLTEAEKESDREQVRRYWHLIAPQPTPGAAMESITLRDHVVDELVARLAEMTGIDLGRLNRLLDGIEPMTADDDSRLRGYFRTSKGFWMRLAIAAATTPAASEGVGDD